MVATAARVFIAVRDTADDLLFAQSLGEKLRQANRRVVDTVQGSPADARMALQAIVARNEQLDVIACSPAAGSWAVFQDLSTKFPAVGSPQLLVPHSYKWPNFLKGDNLLNIANQIVVIAIIAIGMTMVIITAGIDLSVGSLIALSAVVTAWCIRHVAGAEAVPRSRFFRTVGAFTATKHS